VAGGHELRLIAPEIHAGAQQLGGLGGSAGDRGPNHARAAQEAADPRTRPRAQGRAGAEVGAAAAAVQAAAADPGAAAEAEAAPGDAED
jgi:hypothetical protein